MCANEVKAKKYEMSKDNASHTEDSKKEERGKQIKNYNEKFPKIDPFYITWFWPVFNI